jgi:S-DNA-T family DNA segregation ATPase FtsK/SpoIIIE
MRTGVDPRPLRLSFTIDGRDVVVEADSRTTVAELRLATEHPGAATERAGPGPGAGVKRRGVERAGLGSAGWWLDGALLDDAAPLCATRLRDGCIVTTEPAPAMARPPTRGWLLTVVGGPDSGLVLPMPLGAHDLGGVAPFTDPAMSSRHARVTVSADGATVVDLGSATGTTIDGEPAPLGPPGAALRLGQILRLGDNLMTIVVAPVADAATQPGPGGTVELTRPPRLLAPQRAARIAMPAAPAEPTRRRLPLAPTSVPLALGVVMAVAMRAPMYLLFAAASPLVAIASLLTERGQSTRAHREALRAHAAARSEVTSRIAAAVREETAARRTAMPDPAATWLTACLPGRRLWERRRADADALVLRVGVADLPARLVVESERAQVVPQTAPASPVSIPLRAVNVLGLAGPAEATRALARWIVVQLAVHHAPCDAGITVLADRGRGDWRWARWLPHLTPLDPDAAVVSIGSDDATIAARIAELSALLEQRRAADARANRACFPAHVVVLDGARALRASPGIARLLVDGPDVGLCFVCLDDDERLLPEECAATVVVRPGDPAWVDVTCRGVDPLRRVLADHVSEALAERIARALAPVRIVGTDAGDSTLPGSLRLLEILDLDPPTTDAVRNKWRCAVGAGAPLGIGPEGVFSLDLRRDGPHGLVAGTTGSGKSELLRSMVASLAAANPPDALNFVLVDYKGGSAFEACVDLPHTVGLVTDLDAHLVERALTSLTAELRSRERRLAAASISDIDEYDETRRRDLSLPALPRLVIVVDEFAALSRELPAFVHGLVAVAQRGRSLGLHLLLATQRPSGVVSPEIRANADLRICLRVTDAAESVDVIDVSSAASIAKATPGRAYVRSGPGAVTPIQIGRVGGGKRTTATSGAPFVAFVDGAHLGESPARAIPTAPDDAAGTDLSALVRAIRAAAEAEGVAAARSPWLPPLPKRLPLTDILTPSSSSSSSTPAPARDRVVIEYGVADVPAEQSQRIAAFDLARDGHLLAIGGPRSGRSQLLLTLAASAALTYSVADVHMYALDCGDGALLPVAALPHCGAVVSRSQPERATRLLARLRAEVERRHQLPAVERGPRIVLLVDRREGFVSTLGELDNGRLTDDMLTLLRDGATAGVHVVVTGDRSLLAGRVGASTGNKLVFKLADPTDYALVGLNPRALPDDIPPGRGFAPDGIEMQVALLDPDDRGPSQLDALARIAREVARRDAEVIGGVRPFRVDELPARIGFEEVLALRAAGAGPLVATVGVGGDELAAIGPDLATAPAFVVAGPNGSGRSNLLLAMAESLLRAEAPVVVGAPRASPLRDLAGRAGVLDVITDPATPAVRWQELVDVAAPLVVVLDDAELLRDSPAGEVFRAIVTGRLPGRALVFGGHVDSLGAGLSGWQVEAKRARAGALLSPRSPADGDLVGVRLARSETGGPITPGRALLHLGDGGLVAVTVPLMERAPSGDAIMRS